MTVEQPAPGWQRPPFEPGNQVSVGNRGPLEHGAYSPRVVDPLAQQIRDALLADPSTHYLQQPRNVLAVWALARAEAQVQLLTEYVAKCGEESGDGVGDLADERVRSAYLLLHRAETRAQTGRRHLGLDPLSAARLGRDRAATAVDAAGLMARLAELEARGVVVDVELLGDGDVSVTRGVTS